MAECGTEQRTLEDTSTWAVAVVCFFLVVISIFIEHVIHLTGKVSVPRCPILLNLIEFGIRISDFWVESICHNQLSNTHFGLELLNLSLRIMFFSSTEIQ